MLKNKKSTGLKTSEKNHSKQEKTMESYSVLEQKQNYQLPEHKCSLCGKTFRGYVNNPRPLDIKGVVCDECNHSNENDGILFPKERIIKNT